MTSSNVTEYEITHKRTGERVGHLRVHHYVGAKWDTLLHYYPLEDHYIQAYGYDEEDELWEGEVEDLYEFLVRVGEIELK